MTKLRLTIAALLVAIPLLGVMQHADATSRHDDRSHYAKVSGHGPQRVVFIHNGDTEDSCLRARKTGWRRLPNGQHVAVYTCSIP